MSFSFFHLEFLGECPKNKPGIAWHTWRRCPCISTVVGAMHEASRGTLKGAVSAQKSLQGYETETRESLGGTEENSVSPTRDH